MEGQKKECYVEGVLMAAPTIQKPSDRGGMKEKERIDKLWTEKK
jgi:hypothetical protein